MKTKLTFFIFMLFATLTYGQNKAIITFDKLMHDYGQMKEENGKVMAVFNFTNTGKDTLLISNVKVSCGCITADWNKTPVLPSQKGIVKVFYDPYRRPGKFEKSLWVFSNASTPELTLSIKGDVIPKVKTLLDSFPVRNGNIMMAANGFYLKNITNKEIKKDSLLLYNPSYKPITLSFKNLPPFIACHAKPTTIAPKQRGKIYITYDAPKKNEYGIVSDTILLVTNDSVNPEKKLSVNATINDDFSKLTPEQRKNAAAIVFTSEILDYGTVKQGETVKQAFEFTNKGKDMLHIRKAVPYREDCKVYLEGKSSLASGESGKISIEFNTTGQTGEQKRTILLTVNDPGKPFIILIIKGKIAP
ncbi:MAG: DUF1573 domain-containing protein [Bacteroidales bacterium]|nr:DUF1573 domain-containing protein [Bacteroidales bacterium]